MSEPIDRLLEPLPGGEGIADIDGIAPTDLPPVQPALAGQHVHRALDGKGRLVHTKPAHRTTGRIVGVDGPRFDIHILHTVRTAHVTRGPLQHLGTDRGISAAIPQ